MKTKRSCIGLQWYNPPWNFLILYVLHSYTSNMSILFYTLLISSKAILGHLRTLQTIAASLCFHLGRLDKLQGQVMTHSEKVEWWIILMVDCVTPFWLYCPPLHFTVPMRLQNIQAVSITRLIKIRSKPNSLVVVVVVDFVLRIKRIQY